MRTVALPLSPEELYKKGLAHLHNAEKLRALVAFIKAGRENHYEAQQIIRPYINFAQENIPGVRFSFNPDVDVHIQFKVFQSLHADDVIDKNTYIAALEFLNRGFANSTDHKTLAKIRLQLDLNTKKPEAINPYLDRKKGKPNSVIWNDYFRLILPFVKVSALLFGEGLAIPVGLLEYPLLVPLLLKYDGPKHKISHLPGDDPNEIAPRANDFLKWATGIDKKSLDPLRSRIVDTGFAAVAAWIGRGIGLLLSISLISVISLVAFPIYFFHQKKAHTNLAIGRVEDENTALLVQEENPDNVAANLSLMNKGDKSTKSYSEMRLFNSVPRMQVDPAIAPVHRFLTKHLA